MIYFFHIVEKSGRKTTLVRNHYYIISIKCYINSFSVSGEESENFEMFTTTEGQRAMTITHLRPLAQVNLKGYDIPTHVTKYSKAIDKLMI